MVTASLLEKATGGRAKNTLVGPLAAALNDYTPTYGITGRRLAYFIGQTAVESGYFNLLVENLNYSAEGLLKTFPKYFTAAQARQYAKKPQAIANRAYANRMGNGPESSGDGWRYRGRGWIQLTGKENYAKIGKAIGIDLVSDPDRAADPRVAVLTACEYWKSRRINQLCDITDPEKRAKAVTKAVNGGYTHLAERIEVTEAAARALGTSLAMVSLADPVALPQPEETSTAAPVFAGEAPITPESGIDQIKLLQTKLKEKNYYDGSAAIDGLWTDKGLTQAAVVSLQANNDLPLDPKAIMLSDVEKAPYWVIAGRQDKTVADLKAEGDPVVNNASSAKKAGLLTTVGTGILGTFKSVLGIGTDPEAAPIDAAKETAEKLTGIQEVASFMASFGVWLLGNLWVLLPIGGIVIWFLAKGTQQRRLEAHKKAETA